MPLWAVQPAPRYQFTNAIISIYPEVKQLDRQRDYYHRNVLIENNVFKTFDVPLLFAISTDNLKFINNKVIYNDEFKGWGQKPFQFRRCANILIKDNKVLPPRTWTLEDCKLENTPSLKEKVETIAKEIYGADGVTYEPAAEKMLAKLTDLEIGRASCRERV